MKGRYRGGLDCSDNSKLAFSWRMTAGMSSLWRMNLHRDLGLIVSDFRSVLCEQASTTPAGRMGSRTPAPVPI